MSAGLHQPDVRREGRSLAPACHPQLVQDVAHVVAGRGLRDDEAIGDLPVRGAMGHQRYHLAFARREGGSDADEVRMTHFSQALNASRATVSPEMEEEYRSMETKLKQAALVPEGMGFVTPGMIKPVKASKHEP